MKLTINYKNGNKLTQEINGLRYEADAICFTVKKQVYFSVVPHPVYVHFDNIESFEIEED